MNKRCVHRQDSEHHPNCFRKPQWYKNLRLGYLDIEATGLKANQAWMLSWAIKPSDSNKVIYDKVQPQEIIPKIGKFNDTYDFRIMQSLVEEIKNYDGIVGYYSTGFDLPFVRSKAMKYHLPYPRYGDIGHIDCYYHVKSKMLMARSSLAQATEFLEITGKTRLDFSYWTKAGYGDIIAMRELLKHNIADVEILEKLHHELEPYCKFNRNSI